MIHTTTELVTRIVRGTGTAARRGDLVTTMVDSTPVLATVESFTPSGELLLRGSGSNVIPTSPRLWAADPASTGLVQSGHTSEHAVFEDRH